MTIVRNALTDLLIMMIDRSNIRKDTKDTFLTPVLEYIDKNFESYIDMQYLADMAGVSKSRFQKKFKEYTGFPPREYIMRKRWKEQENSWTTPTFR